MLSALNMAERKYGARSPDDIYNHYFDGQLNMSRRGIIVYDCLEKVPRDQSTEDNAPIVFAADSPTWLRFFRLYRNQVRRITVDSSHCETAPSFELTQMLKASLKQYRLNELEVRAMDMSMLEDNFRAPLVTRLAFTGDHRRQYNLGPFMNIHRIYPHVQRLRLDVDFRLKPHDQSQLCAVLARLPLRALYLRHGNDATLTCLSTYLPSLEWLGFGHLDMTDAERPMHFPNIKAFQIASLEGGRMPVFGNLSQLLVASTHYDEAVGEFVEQQSTITHFVLTNMTNMRHAVGMMEHINPKAQVSRLTVIAPMRRLMGLVRLTRLECHLSPLHWGIDMVHEGIKPRDTNSSYCQYSGFSKSELNDWVDDGLAMNDVETQLRRRAFAEYRM